MTKKYDVRRDEFLHLLGETQFWNVFDSVRGHVGTIVGPRSRTRAKARLRRGDWTPTPHERYRREQARSVSAESAQPEGAPPREPPQEGPSHCQPTPDDSETTGTGGGSAPGLGGELNPWLVAALLLLALPFLAVYFVGAILVALARWAARKAFPQSAAMANALAAVFKAALATGLLVYLPAFLWGSGHLDTAEVWLERHGGEAGIAAFGAPMLVCWRLMTNPPTHWTESTFGSVLVVVGSILLGLLGMALSVVFGVVVVILLLFAYAVCWAIPPGPGYFDPINPSFAAIFVLFVVFFVVRHRPPGGD